MSSSELFTKSRPTFARKSNKRSPREGCSVPPPTRLGGLIPFSMEGTTPLGLALLKTLILALAGTASMRATTMYLAANPAHPASLSSAGVTNGGSHAVPDWSIRMSNLLVLTGHQIANKKMEAKSGNVNISREAEATADWDPRAHFPIVSAATAVVVNAAALLRF
jgi:hypothetical protein